MHGIRKMGFPGQLIVFGKKATVVAVGDQVNDILIAAA
jgi:hypothetical protein